MISVKRFPHFYMGTDRRTLDIHEEVNRCSGAVIGQWVYLRGYMIDDLDIGVRLFILFLLRREAQLRIGVREVEEVTDK
jgi:hypothetical protein